MVRISSRMRTTVVCILRHRHELMTRVLIFVLLGIWARILRLERLGVELSMLAILCCIFSLLILSGGGGVFTIRAAMLLIDLKIDYSRASTLRLLS